MKRVFLVHGWEGNPEEGWFPWLKTKLKQKDFEVIVPLMPDPKKPTVQVWVPFLKKLVGKVTQDDFFVGHSLGCITILRLFESLPAEEKAGGTVLVAGFGADLNYFNYDHQLASFFNATVNWAKIKSSCPKFIAIHSSNDPYVSLENSELFKQMLNAKTLVAPDMKHFSGDDGIKNLPIVYDSILKLSS